WSARRLWSTRASVRLSDGSARWRPNAGWCARRWQRGAEEASEDLDDHLLRQRVLLHLLLWSDRRYPLLLGFIRGRSGQRVGCRGQAQVGQDRHDRRDRLRFAQRGGL